LKQVLSAKVTDDFAFKSSKVSNDLSDSRFISALYTVSKKKVSQNVFLLYLL